jgi:3-phenylpropionate/cinnamic acid dioxygenase small subunit
MSAAALTETSLRTPADYLLPVINFYGHEAMLLDGHRFDEWLALLTEDVVYQVPVRIVSKDGVGEYATGALRINDRLAHVEARIKRLSTGWAFAEEPPSRVVRCVGSVTVPEVKTDGRVVARCAVILHRQRAQNETPDVLSYRREDELVAQGGRLLLSKRVILMADNVLRSPNISIFL